MSSTPTLFDNQFLQEYFNLSHLRVIPWIRDPNGLHHPFVFEFELKFFDRTYAHNIYAWMNQWWWLSIVYSIIYVMLIYYGRSLMESRERFQLRVPLILWNLGLAIFSIFGMVRCLPEMVYSLSREGLQYTICNRSNIYGITGYCYHDWTASGRWFVFMNYTVHAMMYSYYAARALQFRIPKWVQITVTIFQLSQMVVGCFVNYKAYIYKEAGATCKVAYSNIFWSFVMYAIYFLLFLHFFFVNYLWKKASSVKTGAEKKDD